MNSEDLYRAIRGVDDDILEESETAGGHLEKRGWLKWGALAACLALFLSVAVLPELLAPSDRIDPRLANDVDSNHVLTVTIYGFWLDGNEYITYFPINKINSQEFAHYGISSEDEIGDEDLGELMGTVTYCGDERLIGSQVYHCAKYPDSDAICILDGPYSREYYTGLVNMFGRDSRVSAKLFTALGLPDQLEQMEILDPEDPQLLLGIVQDEAAIRSIFELLSGKTDCGKEAYQRRLLQAWYDAYGNEDVYYSEKTKCFQYRNEAVHEQAQALWSEGEYLIRITTDSGLHFSIDFLPSIDMFVLNGHSSGYFELTPEETEALSALILGTG